MSLGMRSGKEQRDLKFGDIVIDLGLVVVTTERKFE
jgi:hypothetical protein